MKKYFIPQNYILIALFCSFFWSCTKEEYLPPEVGDQIPYEEETTTFAEVLSRASNTLFYKAWQRSHMENMLKAKGSPRVQFTLLVPDNESLIEAGWNESVIESATLEDLDTLLMRFTFVNRLEGDIASGTLTTQRLTSLLPYTDVIESVTEQTYTNTITNGISYNYYTFVSGTYPYFKASLEISDRQLYVNGAARGEPTVNNTAQGILLSMQGWLDVPTKTASEIIRNDNRFSIYTQLMDYMDAQYHEIFRSANGYYPSDGTSVQYNNYDRDSWTSYLMKYNNTFISRKNTNTTYLQRIGYPNYLPLAHTQNMFFIPTDEAFRQAGFNSIADLVAFNTRRGLPKADVWTIPGNGHSSFYAMRGEFATDSLLDYHHNLGLRYASTGINQSVNFSNVNRNFNMFFNKSLRQDVLGGYPLAVISVAVYKVNGSLSHYENRNYQLPYVFTGSTNGNVRLSVRNGSGEAATVVASDILSLNGVIHAVDRLLLPAGFSLN